MAHTKSVASTVNLIAARPQIPTTVPADRSASYLNCQRLTTSLGRTTSESVQRSATHAKTLTPRSEAEALDVCRQFWIRQAISRGIKLRQGAAGFVDADESCPLLASRMNTASRILPKIFS